MLPSTSLLLTVMSVRASLQKRHPFVEECDCERQEGCGGAGNVSMPGGKGWGGPPTDLQLLLFGCCRR